MLKQSWCLIAKFWENDIFGSHQKALTSIIIPIMVMLVCQHNAAIESHSKLRGWWINLFLEMNNNNATPDDKIHPIKTPSHVYKCHQRVISTPPKHPDPILYIPKDIEPAKTTCLILNLLPRSSCEMIGGGGEGYIAG